jgi:hypothetical protein
MKRVLKTFAGFMVLGFVLSYVILAEKKQENILTGAITLGQTKNNSFKKP